jgi:hypothetical protein
VIGVELGMCWRQIWRGSLLGAAFSSLRIMMVIFYVTIVLIHLMTTDEVCESADMLLFVIHCVLSDLFFT